LLSGSAGWKIFASNTGREAGDEKTLGTSIIAIIIAKLIKYILDRLFIHQASVIAVWRDQ
jgi:hypothetical protein